MVIYVLVYLLFYVGILKILKHHLKFKDIKRLNAVAQQITCVFHAVDITLRPNHLKTACNAFCFSDSLVCLTVFPKLISGLRGLHHLITAKYESEYPNQLSAKTMYKYVEIGNAFCSIEYIYRTLSKRTSTRLIIARSLANTVTRLYGVISILHGFTRYEIRHFLTNRFIKVI